MIRKGNPFDLVTNENMVIHEALHAIDHVTDPVIELDHAIDHVIGTEVHAINKETIKALVIVAPAEIDTE